MFHYYLKAKKENKKKGLKLTIDEFPINNNKTRLYESYM